MNEFNQKIISLADPVLGEEEQHALCHVIDSKWLTMGPRVAEFEQAFALLHKVDSAVAVCSCTAGLHLCLAALGLGPGDEVLVPSLTFVATVNAILYTGATPVFVDIEKADVPHISIEDAEANLSRRTRAVIVMHYGGYLVDLLKWREFADNHRVFLIEDAAHSPAVGEVGRWADASAFSFFGNKNMTTAEGGMVLARDESVLDRIRLMRSHGMTTVTLDRFRGHAFTYDVTALGYNYRMDELRASIGLVQLSHLLKWNQYRKQLTDDYRSLLNESASEVSIPFDRNHPTSAHILPALLPLNANREKIMQKLRDSGIQSSIHYPPVHKFSYYQNRFPGILLPNTEEFFAREITLPLHPGLEIKDIKRVVQSLKNALNP